MTHAEQISEHVTAAAQQMTFVRDNLRSALRAANGAPIVGTERLAWLAIKKLLADAEKLNADLALVS